jgi:hypothetical protein
MELTTSQAVQAYGVFPNVLHRMTLTAIGSFQKNLSSAGTASACAGRRSPQCSSAFEYSDTPLATGKVARGNFKKGQTKVDSQTVARADQAVQYPLKSSENLIQPKRGTEIVRSAELSSRFFRSWRAASYSLRDADDLWTRRLARALQKGKAGKLASGDVNPAIGLSDGQV